MGPDRKDCFYCARDERLTKILMEICRLEASTLYLFREPGGLEQRWSSDPWLCDSASRRMCLFD